METTRDQSLKGLVFNVQRYSVHDGPGIRTLVFMKGCPLKCLWCSNPEGQNPLREVAYYANVCKKCYKCVQICPRGAISILSDGELATLTERCDGCELCVKFCPSNARKMFGYYATADEILDAVSKDSVFYRRSVGGITVGGGEPLGQAEFVAELLKKAKERYGINTAIETCLYTRSERALGVLRYADVVFCDIKHIDPVRHKNLTGVCNAQILSNMRLAVNELMSKNAKFIIRIPLIPGINDDKDNLQGTARFVKELGEVVKIELLPYHELGKQKYRALNRQYPLEGLNIKPPLNEDIERAKAIIEGFGIEVIRT